MAAIPEFPVDSTLMSFISSRRAVRQEYWLEIGKCLCTIFKGGNQGLTLWLNYTYRAVTDGVTAPHLARYEEVCRGLYPGLYDYRANARILHMYALADARTEYLAWRRTFQEKII